ncbi:putative outer membrane protein [Flavobacterium psychrophilum]|uniref:carboxypeptidase-like regulatory domain-containing protein n=1 Tax=Flavobacterium psychrophilum TaxID=96345 RepID=UPI000B7C2C9E|nr:carboxypeptidase-like regulatory domain-containing protein [Flavobacterium psychrophilum]GEJ36079.1 membrane protein [Flavobacterium psychrophilum]GEJ49115.1 membrane protein [Flavobacterium psychrophilum]SNB11290.1 putative outer membrane protein [Flavobacterium psychrophilum]SNB21810.1 putative outer membrane protein [Flavobacterium psychrophilum]
MQKTLLLFLVSFSITAQIKGVVKDSISGKPIPYVNIWVQNENIGTTSEENGEFTISSTDKNKNLIFSALGFEKKIMSASKSILVNLKPMLYQLDEVMISEDRLETKTLEIGNTDNQIYQSFDNGPRIDTKFFPYRLAYKKTKFIQKIAIETDSRIEEATIKIHFYTVDEKGYPSQEMLHKDFIVSVKKGTKKSLFDVSKFNLTMPKKGLFVGFEKLIIEKNKLEKTIIDSKTNKTQIQKTYFPFVMYNFVERAFLYTFSGGKWNRQTKHNDSDSPNKIMVYEPAINLIITN